jgi:hypothetical protein
MYILLDALVCMHHVPRYRSAKLHSKPHLEYIHKPIAMFRCDVYEFIQSFYTGAIAMFDKWKQHQHGTTSDISVCVCCVHLSLPSLLLLWLLQQLYLLELLQCSQCCSCGDYSNNTYSYILHLNTAATLCELLQLTYCYCYVIWYIRIMIHAATTTATACAHALQWQHAIADSTTVHCSLAHVLCFSAYLYCVLSCSCSSSCSSGDSVYR